jgi:hypothetical protein
MSPTIILAIALVCSAAAAVNGFIGSMFLLLIWLWLYGGVLPSIGVYLKVPPNYPWAPHLILPLVAFLCFWQWKLRGKIGPQWGLRHVIRQVVRRRETAAPAAA